MSLQFSNVGDQIPLSNIKRRDFRSEGVPLFPNTSKLLLRGRGGTSGTLLARGLVLQRRAEAGQAILAIPYLSFQVSLSLRDSSKRGLRRRESFVRLVCLAADLGATWSPTLLN